MRKRILSIILASVLSLGVFVPATTIPVNAKAKPVVVVIDPGHGGPGDKGDLGAEYNGMTEKNLNLQVANAMKAELEKYDNVTVYLTRSTDQRVSLGDRANFAKSVNADFMFSIHFNASYEHKFYGSEVWCSAFGQFYQKGQDFGKIELEELGSLGLYQKGVKTRLNSKGTDYYGVIRQSTALNIPCVIIEHAYMDHGYDVPKVKDSNFLNTLGVKDATAVAKYFKLTSSKGGGNYSGYKYAATPAPSGAVPNDTTGPEVCEIKALSTDPSNGNVLIELTTKDNQSPVIYFSYSYDGGKSYSTLQMWDRSKPTQSFNVKVPSGYQNPSIICRAYNIYEQYSESNAVPVQAFKY